MRDQTEPEVQTKEEGTKTKKEEVKTITSYNVGKQGQARKMEPKKE